MKSMKLLTALLIILPALHSTAEEPERVVTCGFVVPGVSGYEHTIKKEGGRFIARKTFIVRPTVCSEVGACSPGSRSVLWEYEVAPIGEGNFVFADVETGGEDLTMILDRSAQRVIVGYHGHRLVENTCWFY